MRNIIILSLFFIYAALAVSAPGNDHGNGGGVICINKKCQTLADSGLSISPNYPDFWIPSEEVLGSINRQIGRYPFEGHVRNRILQRALLKLTHFQAVTIVDPEKLEKIKNDYIQAIKATSPNFDFSNFKIVAISSDDTVQEQNTYILPEFLELGIDDQAKMLIHEGLYRGRPSTDLKYILQLESALKMYAGLVDGMPARQTAVTAQISAQHLNILNKSEFLTHILATTFGAIGLPGHFSASVDENAFRQIFKFDYYTDQSAYLSVNADFVRQNASSDHRVAVILLNLNEKIKLQSVALTTQRLVNEVICIQNYGFLYYYKFFNRYLQIQDAEKLNLLLPR